jgi:hypothetical protein
MKRLLLAGGAALAALVAFLVWRTPPPPATPDAGPPSAPVFQPAQAPSPTASPLPGCRFVAGQTMAFDVTSTTTVTLADTLARFSGGVGPQGGSTSARLSLEVVRVETQRAVLLGRLSAASTSLVTAGGPGVEAPWLVRVNERCEVTDYARASATPATAARQQQSLLAELWFSVPPGPGPAAVAFDTGLGRATALVLPAGGADADDVVRTIQRYERAWSPSMNGVSVERSRLEVRRGQGPWFDAMEGVEASSVPGVVTSAQATLTVAAAPADGAALVGASRNEADYEWGRWFEEVPDASLRPFAAGDHQQRVEAMRDVTWPQALEKMLMTFEFTDNVYEQARDMSAFLDAHPEAIDEYAGALLTEFEPEWKAAGFLVLAQTRHVAAREVLLDVWRERDAPSMDRVRSSLALVSRRDVGVPLARELLAESRRDGTPAQRNVSQQALLHAGMLAGLHPEAAELKREVRQGLALELSSRPTPGERAAVYSAIGNTGDLTFLPELDQASRHPDPEWRAIVPIALRRMPIDESRPFTLEWLRRETSPDVMRELWQSIQHQYQDVGRVADVELAAEAVKYLRRQPRLLTRQSIVQLLAPLVGVNDEVRAAFREQLKLEYEARTGMFAFVASCLPESDVQAVLATIPTLADQHVTATVAAPPPSSPALPSEVPPPSMLPTLPTGEAP